MTGSKVEILLSAYNGAEFIGQQVDSLLAQEYPHCVVRVRDDGSSDDTLERLAPYVAAGRVDVRAGPRLGVVASFAELLRTVPADADYIAFADQDDVWLPDKIGRAVALLSGRVPATQPGLYCSRLSLVDRQLIPHGSTPLPARGPSFGNSLVENIATGCTIVLNRAALDLLMPPWPEGIVMHDWWCYQVVSGCGHAIYDPQSSILYRQHAGNTVGIALHPVVRWQRRLVRHLSRRGASPLLNQIKALRARHGADLKPECRSLLAWVLDNWARPAGRLSLCASRQVYRQSLLDDAVFRFLIAVGRL